MLKARRVSKGQAPVDAVVDLPSHEALELMEAGDAIGVDVHAPETKIPPAWSPQPGERASDEQAAAPVADAALGRKRGRR